MHQHDLCTVIQGYLVFDNVVFIILHIKKDASIYMRLSNIFIILVIRYKYKTIMSLEGLNEKQLGKEFKAVTKDIKSKDNAIKSSAIAKLAEPRYFSEGSCIFPLFESMIVKKVTVYK